MREYSKEKELKFLYISLNSKLCFCYLVDSIRHVCDSIRKNINHALYPEIRFIFVLRQLLCYLDLIRIHSGTEPL